MTDDRAEGRSGPAKGSAPRVPAPRRPENELAMAQIIHRHTLLMAIVERLGRIMMVVAFAVPIWFTQPVFAALAGETTNASAVLIMSLAVNAALAVANMLQYRRRRNQGDEIRRQRERSDTLESLVRVPRTQPIPEGEK